MKKFLVVLVAVLMAGLVFAAQTGSYENSIKIVKTESGKLIVSPTDSIYGCGDGILQTYFAEQCDRDDFGAQSCSSILGSDYSGSLSCDSKCIIDLSRCSLTVADLSPVKEVVNRGSSSSRSKTSSSSSGTCIPDWNCENWQPCKKDYQNRTCVDLNSCGVDTNKPKMDFFCGEIKLDESGKIEVETEENKSFFSWVSGAATGIIGNKGFLVGGIMLLVVVALLITISRLKKSEEVVASETKE